MTTVSSGQTLLISFGQTELGTLVPGGGTIEFLSKGLATTTTPSGFAAQQVVHSLAGVPFDPDGTVQLVAGNRLQITANGQIYILQLDPARSFASATFILGPDAAGHTQINVTNGPVTVSSGGTVSTANIFQWPGFNGFQAVSGTAVGRAVDTPGARQGVFSDETASGTTLAGGEQNIRSGGLAIAPISSSGALEGVLGGDMAGGTTASALAAARIGTGGVASATTVMGGGLQDVLAGGTASATSLSGDAPVYAGGTASGTALHGGAVTINGGLVELADAANAGDVNFRSGGALRFNQPETHTGPAAGLRPGDLLGLEKTLALNAIAGGTTLTATRGGGSTFQVANVLSGIRFAIQFDGMGRSTITASNLATMTHDFAGRGVSDILFRNDATGDTGFYQMIAGANAGWVAIGPSSTAYAIAGIGDFNGDGTSDILFRDDATGDTGFYQMSGGSNAGWHSIGASSTAYGVAGIGDFNGDATSDILWRNDATGDVGFYEMDNGVNAGWRDIGGSSTAYAVAGIGDFNGDNTSDILFRNNATGDTGFFQIEDGVNAGWRPVGATSTAYDVAGVGDFNRDGTSDILWRNDTTGDLGFYEMDNGVNAGWRDIGGSSTAYSVAAVGDFTGDATSDILFRNSATGDTGFYQISDGANAGWRSVGASSAAYIVVT